MSEYRRQSSPDRGWKPRSSFRGGYNNPRHHPEPQSSRQYSSRREATSERSFQNRSPDRSSRLQNLDTKASSVGNFSRMAESSRSHEPKILVDDLISPDRRQTTTRAGTSSAADKSRFSDYKERGRALQNVSTSNDRERNISDRRQGSTNTEPYRYGASRKRQWEDDDEDYLHRDRPRGSRFTKSSYNDEPTISSDRGISTRPDSSTPNSLHNGSKPQRDFQVKSRHNGSLARVSQGSQASRLTDRPDDSRSHYREQNSRDYVRRSRSRESSRDTDWSQPESYRSRFSPACGSRHSPVRQARASPQRSAPRRYRESSNFQHGQRSNSDLGNNNSIRRDRQREVGEDSHSGYRQKSYGYRSRSPTPSRNRARSRDRSNHRGRRQSSESSFRAASSISGVFGKQSRSPSPVRNNRTSRFNSSASARREPLPDTTDTLKGGSDHKGRNQMQYPRPRGADRSNRDYHERTTNEFEHDLERPGKASRQYDDRASVSKHDDGRKVSSVKQEPVGVFNKPVAPSSTQDNQNRAAQRRKSRFEIRPPEQENSHGKHKPPTGREVSSPKQSMSKDLQGQPRTPQSTSTPHSARSRPISMNQEMSKNTDATKANGQLDTSVPRASAPEASFYERIGQVGEGTYGKVYKARHRGTDELVALKRIRLEQERDGFPITSMREIKLLQRLKHPSVVKLHEMMIEKSAVYMVFEYMDHDLTGILANSNFNFEASQIKDLAYQLFDGLAYLHHRGVLHRDIKGSNILLNNAGQLKLADFGLARFYHKSRRNADYTNRVITLWFRPPELLLGATAYDAAVDVWSAGCIFMELFTKLTIFPGRDEIHQLECIYRILGSPTSESWPGVAQLPWFELIKFQAFEPKFESLYASVLSPAALDLSLQILQLDPLKRPLAKNVLLHPYFTSEEPKAERRTLLNIVESHEWDTKQRRRDERAKKAREVKGKTERQGAT